MNASNAFCLESLTSTIGKGKVLDIRDTVETHDSQGFFLAVNTQVSAPLTEKLESLKSKGLWVSWWNRDDIEMRLSKNQDLIPLSHEKLSIILCIVNIVKNYNLNIFHIYCTNKHCFRVSLRSSIYDTYPRLDSSIGT